MKNILALLLVVSLSATAFAQTKSSQPFVAGVIDKIVSKELSETRTLNIYLPDGYAKNDTAPYPVIYLLDGSANEDFLHIIGLVQYLNMIGTLPESIVVGVANVDRRRDFTFPTSVEEDKKLVPVNGGAAKFISFVEKELKPYVEKNYKVSKQSTIIGQSLGGLITSELLIRKPGLFTNYIIVSASVWWDNGSLFAHAEQIKNNIYPANTKVYIAVGEEGDEMKDGAKRLNDLLLKQNVNSSFHFMPAENHLTILHNCIYTALQEINKVK
ncbi:MAG: alpha/beta hydrolase [Sphingobacteriales bacterium]|nr:MAG: alpha/beta hydrolase [Sphingobacteriales bacterium]